MNTYTVKYKRERAKWTEYDIFVNFLRTYSQINFFLVFSKKKTNFSLFLLQNRILEWGILSLWYSNDAVCTVLLLTIKPRTRAVNYKTHIMKLHPFINESFYYRNVRFYNGEMENRLQNTTTICLFLRIKGRGR